MKILGNKVFLSPHNGAKYTRYKGKTYLIGRIAVKISESEYYNMIKTKGFLVSALAKGDIKKIKRCS